MCVPTYLPMAIADLPYLQVSSHEVSTWTVGSEKPRGFAVHTAYVRLIRENMAKMFNRDTNARALGACGVRAYAAAHRTPVCRPASGVRVAPGEVRHMDYGSVRRRDMKQTSIQKNPPQIEAFADRSVAIGNNSDAETRGSRPSYSTLVRWIMGSMHGSRRLYIGLGVSLVGGGV